jgi:hypothetical protein
MPAWYYANNGLSTLTQPFSLESTMNRDEALEKIAWHQLKKLTGEEATGLIIQFFNEPLKPSLREKLNITAVLQWKTHHPPADLKPGNPIYRPVLIERMMDNFRGATNEYLAGYLKYRIGLEVDTVVGDLPSWLPCPACGYHTYAIIGDWDTCPTCGWVSDPVQEAMPDDPTGANGISLNEARENFQVIGAITKTKLVELDPEEKKKYPRTI